jgi:hypothetical protein
MLGDGIWKAQLVDPSLFASIKANKCLSEITLLVLVNFVTHNILNNKIGNKISFQFSAFKISCY